MIVFFFLVGYKSDNITGTLKVYAEKKKKKQLIKVTGLLNLEMVRVAKSSIKVMIICKIYIIMNKILSQ